MDSVCIILSSISSYSLSAITAFLFVWPVLNGSLFSNLSPPLAGFSTLIGRSESLLKLVVLHSLSPCFSFSVMNRRGSCSFGSLHATHHSLTVMTLYHSTSHQERLDGDPFTVSHFPSSHFPNHHLLIRQKFQSACSPQRCMETRTRLKFSVFPV